jgi:hypothetical protein
MKKYILWFVGTFLVFAVVTGITIFNNWESILADPKLIMISILYFLTLVVVMGIIIGIALFNPFKEKEASSLL